MNYLKSVFTKVQNGFLISAGICVLVGLCLSFIGIKVSDKVTSQKFAERWSKDSDFAQVSCFFSEKADFEEANIKELSYRIEAKLNEDSIDAKNKNARRWIYSYCAGGNISVSSKKSSMTVRAIGVGGDFFSFHPFELLNGSYFDGDDVMKDKVVIDRDMAWTLFGSNDVVGQLLMISGTPHVICGVIERESGRINDLSGNDKPTIYLSYESLQNYGSVDYINAFEALLPNPVTGYALEVLKSGISLDESRFELVENTGRYNWVNLIKRVKYFGTRGMNLKAIVFPFWENVARANEDYLVPVAAITLALFGYAAIIVIILVIRMWTKRTIHFKDIRNFVERLFEKARLKRSKRKEKKNAEA